MALQMTKRLATNAAILGAHPYAYSATLDDVEECLKERGRE